MNRRILLALAVAALSACQPGTVRIDTPQGVLRLDPLADDAIRVRITPEGAPVLDELILTESVKPPKYRVERHEGDITVRLPRLTAEYRAASQTLRFLDADGRVLLEERGREILPTEVQGVAAYAVSQRFDSPDGEHLYGTGQFQDGYLDIRGLSRRLTQVNTQISLPMVLSSRGWGLLWHNYGLTEFNPCNGELTLSPVEETSQGITVNATGTSGNRRERRFFQAFSGEIDLPADG